jgi:hypothetical protein
VARMERSVIRANLSFYDRSVPDYAALHPGYSRSVAVLARTMRGIVTVALSAWRQIATRPAVTAPPPMQRETVPLSLEAVLTVALVCLRRCDWRCRRAAGDKGRQALDVAVVVFGRSVLRMTPAKARLLAMLLARLEELRITRQIGLRIPGTEGWLLARTRQTGRVVIALLVHVVTHIVPAVHSAFAAEEGSRLPELFLRGGDQAQIMLRMLEIALLGNRIPGRLGVARKLQVFLGNVGRGASHFDIRSVRFVHPRERIVTLAVVAPPHTLVWLVSHD